MIQNLKKYFKNQKCKKRISNQITIDTPTLFEYWILLQIHRSNLLGTVSIFTA